jgi:hypothetical protein
VLSLALVATCSLSWAVAGQQPARAEPVAAVFERLSKTIVVLGPDDFLWGFRERWSMIPRRELAPVREFSEYVKDGRWKATDLLPLLAHSDAKVRTLALVALYGLEDPRVLPDIFPSTQDDATTFSAMVPRADFLAGDGALTPDRVRSQTVGEIATAILNTYMESGGYFYGPSGLRGQPGFPQYWKAHALRSSSAGWWKVRLARAALGSSPTPQEQYSAIRHLRAEIDRLPQPERTYVLLWLNGENGSAILVSEEELVGFAQRLGPDALIDILTRAIRSDDPDLQPSPNNNGPYARMCLFVLQHAKPLLRREDAQALLDRDAWERDYQARGIVDPLISPWWAIAAAELNEKDALAILTSAHGRFSTEYDGFRRLELAKALWRLLGEPHTASVANWFYAELPLPHLYTWGMSGTLDALLRTGGRRNTLLAQAIIEDSRFDTMNWKSLEVLARMMNSWNEKEIVAPTELDAAWSPMGIDFFDSDRPAALRQYPKETRELLERLAEWRRAMRESLAGILGK